MIELKAFLVEKQFPVEEIEELINLFFEGNPIVSVCQKIAASNKLMEGLVENLNDYLELCKEDLLSKVLEGKEYANEIIEMIELLSGVLLGLYLLIDKKERNLMPNIFFQ